LHPSEIRPDEQQERVRYHLRERGWGKFIRHIELPNRLEANRAHSEFANGVLTLTLPKIEAAKPKRITIQANGQKTIEGQGRQARLESGNR
jgi:HSP20 family protein